LDIDTPTQSRGKYALSDAQVVLNTTIRGSKGSSKQWMELDQGTASTVYHTRTHLGRHLQPGDTVKGYFLRRANINNADFEALDQSRLPDIILVKKSYPIRRKKNRHRNWKLKSIAKEAEEGPDVSGRGALGRRGGLDQERVERDYENFLRDLEEDPELRATVNLYKTDVHMSVANKKTAKSKAPSGMDVDVDSVGENGALADTEDTEDDEDETDFPEITTDELLDAMDELTIEEKEN